MKKALLCGAMLLGISSMSHCMEDVLAFNDWRMVLEEIWKANSRAETKQLVSVLINTKKDLNASDKGGRFLLFELLRAIRINSFESTNFQERRYNIRFTLKELLKYDKLNANLQSHGRSIVTAADEDHYPTEKIFSGLLNDILIDVRLEKESAVLRRRGRILEGCMLGLICLFVGTIVYSWYTDKEKPSDDANDAQDVQEKDDTKRQEELA